MNDRNHGQRRLWRFILVCNLEVDLQSAIGTLSGEARSQVGRRVVLHGWIHPLNLASSSIVDPLQDLWGEKGSL